MASVFSVPPAYLERSTSSPPFSSPLSSQSFSGPSTTNNEGFAGSRHTVGRHASMGDPASRDSRPISLSPTALSPTTSTFNHMPVYPTAMRVASFSNSDMTSEMSRFSFPDGEKLQINHCILSLQIKLQWAASCRAPITVPGCNRSMRPRVSESLTRRVLQSEGLGITVILIGAGSDCLLLKLIG